MRDVRMPDGLATLVVSLDRNTDDAPHATLLREQDGLTPKQCAQVFRFRRACGLLAAGSPLADVAVARGYHHDKTHLCHEFPTMSGLTPRSAGASPNTAASRPESPR